MSNAATRFTSNGIATAFTKAVRAFSIAIFFCATLLIQPLQAESRAAEVVREMNFARQQPAIYARYLEDIRGHFHGNILALPGRTMLRTREGTRAVDEAIRFLRQTRPLAPVLWSNGIAQATAEHVADQASGALGHGGSDRSNPGERMNRHGAWSSFWGENVSYGKSNARDVVVALIIDDGLRNRKHRKNIFNPAFNYAAAAFGPHARYGTVCSIDFAAGFTEAGEVSSLFARN